MTCLASHHHRGDRCDCVQKTVHTDRILHVHETDDVSHDADTSILLEAHELVNGDRARDYGPPDEDYGRAVDIYHAMTGRRTIEDAEDGIRFMVCVKLSRMAVSPHKRDHYVDGCGYLDCLYRVVNPKNERTPHE